MSNPLFAALGGAQTAQNVGFSQMMAQFDRFRSAFQGDARAQVQQLLNSGQMTQAQYNQLGQMASQLLGRN